MLNEWFDETFMPSIYRMYIQRSVNEENENQLVFLSEKQYQTMVKYSTKISDNDYRYLWENFMVDIHQRNSRQNKTYYTIEFTNIIIKNFEKSLESVIEKLLYLRDKNNPNLCRYAQCYYDSFLALLSVSELDMTDDDEKLQVYAHELNKFFTNALLAIGKFIT